MKNIFYLLIFLIIAVVIMNILRGFFSAKEGMENSTSTADGIAGNAENYANLIKTSSTALQDSFLINKYKNTYENIIINMDDLINNLMLKTTLTLDVNNPKDTIEDLAKMQQAKTALNSVMKFIDEQ